MAFLDFLHACNLCHYKHEHVQGYHGQGKIRENNNFSRSGNFVNGQGKLLEVDKVSEKVREFVKSVNWLKMKRKILMAYKRI